MNSGIYCKRKNNNRLYNSILIDEYNQCVGENLKVETRDETAISQNTSGYSSRKVEKWEENMNVRALFSENGYFYEAVIKKIYDDKYAEVQFFGYNNLEAVKVEHLKPSKGPRFIREQEEQAERDKIDKDTTSLSYDNFDECKDNEEGHYGIDWIEGMPCRALYKENNVIYEGTVMKVDRSIRRAVIQMTGYNVDYEADFDDMYESILELRIKQETLAKKIEKSKITSDFSNTGLPNMKDGTVPVGFNPQRVTNQPAPGVTIPVPPLPDAMRSDISAPVGQPFTNLQGNNCSHNQCSGMMQPQTENDALACLISSNYLSGYYAGFYDCLRKVQGQRNSS